MKRYKVIDAECFQIDEFSGKIFTSDLKATLVELRKVIHFSGLPDVYLFDKDKNQYHIDSDFTLDKVLNVKSINWQYTLRPAYKDKSVLVNLSVFDKESVGVKKLNFDVGKYSKFGNFGLGRKIDEIF